MKTLKLSSSGNLCELCGGKASETHHIMNGAGMRKKSDEDGLVIRVCPRCHRLIHENYLIRLDLKQKAQRMYLETHTLEEWMRRYRKSYL